MKTILGAPLFLLLLALSTGPLRAQVILRQDFSAGGPATNYVGSPPGLGQFSAISPQTFLASDFPPPVGG